MCDGRCVHDSGINSHLHIGGKAKGAAVHVRPATLDAYDGRRCRCNHTCMQYTAVRRGKGAGRKTQALSKIYTFIYTYVCIYYSKQQPAECWMCGRDSAFACTLAFDSGGVQLDCLPLVFLVHTHRTASGLRNVYFVYRKKKYRISVVGAQQRISTGWRTRWNAHIARTVCIVQTTLKRNLRIK